MYKPLLIFYLSLVLATILLFVFIIIPDNNAYITFGCLIVAVVFFIWFYRFCFIGTNPDVDKYGRSRLEQAYRAALVGDPTVAVFKIGREFYIKEKGLDPLLAENMIANDIRATSNDCRFDRKF